MTPKETMFRVMLLSTAILNAGYCLCLTDGASTAGKNSCSEAVCPRNSQCIEGPDSLYKCECLSGFTGKDCTAILTPSIGEMREETRGESNMESICSRANCSDHGVCIINHDEEFSCNCFEDYTGPLCNIKLTFNSCAELNCSANSICKPSHLDVPWCICAPGYTGDMCDIPFDCLELNCSENSVCSQRNDTLEYFCDCDFGYEGQQCTNPATTVQTDIYEYTSTDTIMTTVFGSPNRVNEIVGVLGGGIVAFLLVIFLVVAFTLFKSKKKDFKKVVKKTSNPFAFRGFSKSKKPSEGNIDMPCDRGNILEEPEVCIRHQCCIKESHVNAALNSFTDVRGMSPHFDNTTLYGESAYIQKDCAFSERVSINTQNMGSQITYPAIAEADAETLFDIDTNYVDHVVKTFDANGGVCKLENCTLSIPKGAIPQDKVVAIEIGVTICTELMSLLPLDMTPVSPIIQLCVLNDPKFKFTKPVMIQILHFLDISCDEEVQTMNLHFLKSYHNLPCFHTTDGQEEFPANTHHGTLTINHFCSFCIAAGKASFDPGKVYYYIMSAIPKRIVSPKWEIIYFIIHSTCCRIVEKQYSSADFEIKKVNMFKFNRACCNDPYIEVDFKRELEGGWYLALLLGTKIKVSAIDYTRIEPEVLKCMEEDRLYPPRFTISISGTNADKTATLALNFRGTVDDFTTEVLLEPFQRNRKIFAVQRPTKPTCEPAHMPEPLTFQHGAIHKVPSTQSLPNLGVYQGSPPPLGFHDTVELHCAPTHLDLMNHIAVNIPTKWRDIGLQLGLRVTDLDVIEARHFSDYKRCFSAVFNLWENQLTSPYSWSTILLALTSPLVGECRLAEQIKHVLIQATISPRMRKGSSRITILSNDSTFSSNDSGVEAKI